MQPKPDASPREARIAASAKALATLHDTLTAEQRVALVDNINKHAAEHGAKRGERGERGERGDAASAASAASAAHAASAGRDRAARVTSAVRAVTAARRCTSSRTST